ncbi:MAG: hypothetical protein ATN31_08925 [Candidatus Epulonipiscioides saccharophilum]|nr:MAG: hypothetical protein ATN31_08925 [Epulopiscium sp. AS2M-Bin001]
MKKVWIIGSTSKVGQELLKLLNVREIEVLDTDVDEVDITDLADVYKYVRLNRPETIINCSNAKETFDPDQIFKVNAVAARNISLAAHDIDAKLIHLSTCEVFGNHEHKNTPYTEFDLPTPNTIYGLSKTAGERYVRDFKSKYIIIRRGLTYGSFIQETIEACKANNPIKAANNEFIQPTSPKELAKFIVDVINSKDYGIYHVVNTGAPSKYDIAVEIAKILKSKSKITAVTSETGSYKILENFMLEKVKGYHIPTWQDSLREYLKKK